MEPEEKIESFLGSTSPALQPPLIHRVVLPPGQLGGPPLGLFHYAHAFQYGGAQNQTQCVVQMWSHKCSVKCNDHFPWPMGYTLAGTAQCSRGLCHKGPHCLRVLHSDMMWVSADALYGCTVQRRPGDPHILGDLHMVTLSIISSTLWKTV